MICTFDSNVLVYALVEPPELKAERARDLILRAGHGNATILLLQVLSEFSYVAMRKYRRGPLEIEYRIDALCETIPVEVAAQIDLSAALDLVHEHRIGFWDALLCSTARRSGLQYLLSEDMQDGRRLGGLTIVNPFRPDNAALIDRILPP